MSAGAEVFEVATRVRYEAEGFAKVALASSPRILLGLNCFESGQSQPVHAHAGQDKFYFVIEGVGTFRLAGESRSVGPGGCVWAPAGIDHGVVNESADRLVLLVGMAPAPGGDS